MAWVWSHQDKRKYWTDEQGFLRISLQMMGILGALAPAFRFYRRSDLDTWASKPEQPRDDLLRELIDQLPEIQQHLVSRVYFGQAHRTDAALEIDISPRKAKEELEEALNTLRRLLLDNHEVGALSAAALARQPARPVPQPRDVDAARLDT